MAASPRKRIVRLRQRRQVVDQLTESLLKVLARGFVFDRHLCWYEKIDPPNVPGRRSLGLLLVDPDRLPVDAEQCEELLFCDTPPFGTATARLERAAG